MSLKTFNEFNKLNESRRLAVGKGTGVYVTVEDSGHVFITDDSDNSIVLSNKNQVNTLVKTLSSAMKSMNESNNLNEELTDDIVSELVKTFKSVKLPVLPEEARDGYRLYMSIGNDGIDVDDLDKIYKAVSSIKKTYKNINLVLFADENGEFYISVN